MKKLLLACTIFAATGAWPQVPLEFKGIVVGQSSARDVLAKFPGAELGSLRLIAFVEEMRERQCGPRNYTAPSPCETAIRELFKLPGDQRTQFIHFALMASDGPVGSISLGFARSGFQAMRDALVRKYGDPTTTSTDIVRNGMGAQFDRQIVAWERPDGRIRLLERSGNINESWLEIATTEMLAKRAEDATRRKREDVDKL